MLGALLVLPPEAGAQGPVREIEVLDGACESCGLKLERLTSLGGGGEEEPLIDEGWPSVLRDSRGRFLVASTVPRNEVLVFDSTGRYVESWGRGGEGPGEFLHIRKLLLLPEDSVLVLDPGNARVTALDRRGEVAYSFSAPFRLFDVERTSEGSIIGSGVSPTSDRIGYLFHRIDSSGRILSSFGGDVPILPDRPSTGQRWLARDGGRGFWAARPDRYEVEKWTSEGVRIAVVKRVPEWFPLRDSEGAVDFFRERPNPWLQGVFVDDQGLLWVLSRIPAEDWAPVEHWIPRSGWGRFYDTVVEVIHPETGELMVSQRYPWYGDGFTNDGLIVSHRGGADGTMILDVWKPVFTQDVGEQHE